MKNTSVKAQQKPTENSKVNTDDTKKLELQKNNGAQSSSVRLCEYLNLMTSCKEF